MGINHALLDHKFLIVYCEKGPPKFYIISLFKILERKLKGAFSGLTQFLAIESPLKMMKNDFYFTLKVLFVLKIFKFLS